VDDFNEDHADVYLGPRYGFQHWQFGSFNVQTEIKKL
jgi:hypothetical protein